MDRDAHQIKNDYLNIQTLEMKDLGEFLKKSETMKTNQAKLSTLHTLLMELPELQKTFNYMDKFNRTQMKILDTKDFLNQLARDDLVLEAVIPDVSDMEAVIPDVMSHMDDSRTIKIDHVHRKTDKVNHPTKGKNETILAITVCLIAFVMYLWFVVV